MKPRHALGAVAAGLGAVAVANRALGARAEPLEPPLEGSHGTYRWRGMDVHYTEAGPDEAERSEEEWAAGSDASGSTASEGSAPRTVVLLHGINAAGSSGEFREVFERLSERYHVVAPDLPGFGCSDRPSISYSAALYEAFVADFLAEYDDPAVVASSLSCAYVAAAAPDLSALVCLCPTAVAGPDRLTWLRELLRAPLLGTFVFNLLGSKASIRYFNADHGYYDPVAVSESWTDYEWQTTHQRGARFAPASFVSGFLNSDVDLGAALRTLDCPITFVWGRETEITPLADGRDLAEAADARLVVVDDAKLLPHVEHPGAFLDTLEESLNVSTVP